jgi:hypothetical protein
MSSCEPIQRYSEIPEIHFKKLVFEDRTDPLDETFKKAVLSFSFIDGDGDLGVPEKATERDSKIFYTWQQKLSDGTYASYQFTDGTITQKSEIPYNSVMDKSEAQNKVLKGTIEIELETPKKPQGIDIMRVEFYITDRARNQSNIEYTPDFSILNPPDELQK